MPLKELLDPQGKAVMGGLQSLGLGNVSDVRIGKSISLQIEAATADEAKKVAEEAGRSGRRGDQAVRPDLRHGQIVCRLQNFRAAVLFTENGDHFSS